MVIREMVELENPALEKTVRALLSSSRGKKAEDILNNPDALADYIADAWSVVSALSPDDSFRLLQLCEILSTKHGRSSTSSYIKTQITGGGSGPRMIEA